MKRFSLASFRHISAAEDAMARAVMPRTSAADPARTETEKAVSAILAARAAAPLTFTIGEVVHA